MSEQDEDEKRAYEERLRRRLVILKKQLEEGKIKIAPGLGLIESLKAMRYLPDGSIDLNTVDGSVRSMALVTEQFHDREELKNTASLAEIQNTYFKFIDDNFGEYFKIMIDRKMTPHEAGVALSRKESSISQLTENLSGFLGIIDEFWESASEIAYAHVEDMTSALKGVFGGDLFPSNTENIASKCGLYTDTLILPDPFIRSKAMFELWEPQQKAYYLIKHGLNLLQYRTLACADVNPPIVAILPDRTEQYKDEKRFVAELGLRDALIHAKHVFGREFSSYEELTEYAESLDTIEKAEKAVQDQSRVLFDLDWEGSFGERLERAIKRTEHAKIIGTENPGIIIATQAIGRMGVSNEVLIKASRLRATPIIEVPTSWKYLVWKMEYDALRAEKELNLPDLHVVRGLQDLAENQMEWLGKIPPDALIEVRKTGAIDEIRSLLGGGISELAKANPGNFHRTSDKIFDNIQAAFRVHRENIAKLTEKKWKFAGSDIGSWVVVGSLAVTAAATGAPVWGLAALAADQILDSPKLRDIPKSIKELAEESRRVKKSPVGILFRLSNIKD